MLDLGGGRTIRVTSSQSGEKVGKLTLDASNCFKDSEQQLTLIVEISINNQAPKQHKKKKEHVR